MIRSDYDWTSTSPMRAVLETVSDAENAPERDLPPLRSSVDPDALNGLLERAIDGPRGHVQIDFWYAGWEVTVESDGSVVVTPQEGTN